jgi:SAM-dependent methyltransferase
MTTTSLSWLVPLLVCPICRGPLEFEPDPSADGMLLHAGGACRERYPVIDRIPRLLRGAARAALVTARATWLDLSPDRLELAAKWSQARGVHDVVAGFDYEWSAYRDAGTPEQSRIFELYFELMPLTAFRKDAIVLDAGCSAGRWAIQIARRGPRVIGLDLGLSVEVAARNLRGLDAALLQADVHDVPLKEAAVDWAYSLGVLHHVDAPVTALQEVVRSIKPGGSLLLYLYYALDNRGFAFRTLFRGVDVARRIISVLPRPLAHMVALAVAAWCTGRSHGSRGSCTRSGPDGSLNSFR